MSNKNVIGMPIFKIEGTHTYLRPNNHDLWQLYCISAHSVEDVLKLIYDGYKRFHFYVEYKLYDKAG